MPYCQQERVRTRFHAPCDSNDDSILCFPGRNGKNIRRNGPLEGVFTDCGRTQGQRTLSLLCGQDLQQEVVVPAGNFAFSFDAVLRWVLLQQADGEAAEPGEVVGQTPIARPALVFSERDVEHPV